MAVIETVITPCTTSCPFCGMGNFNACASETVESEICFVPAIAPDDISSVVVDIDPANFQIEFVCCNLIVVCGFMTKKVFEVNPNPELPPILLKEIDIPVQIKVPIQICTADQLTGWKVTGVEVCTGCFVLTCPDNNNTATFHKLMEKDIVAVQVDRRATA